MTIENEQTIINQTKSGDRNAYALLVGQYSGAIFNLAFRMTNSYEDANDLAQDAFMRAYESLESFDVTRRFFPWLYTIALNGIRNHLKTRKEVWTRDFPDRSDQLPGAGDIDPEQIVMDQQEKENVNRWLQQLPLNLKEAVVLRYFQNLPFEEIAVILDISSSAAKMRVYRGLEKLKVLIAGNS